MSNILDPHGRSPRPRPEYSGWSQSYAGDTHVISLTGELDRDAVTELCRWMTDVIGSSTAPTIALDLSNLRFIDAGCVRVIVNACAAATSQGHEIRVDGLHGIPERVFTILELMPMLARGGRARRCEG